MDIQPTFHLSELSLREKENYRKARAAYRKRLSKTVDWAQKSFAQCETDKQKARLLEMLMKSVQDLKHERDHGLPKGSKRQRYPKNSGVLPEGLS